MNNKNQTELLNEWYARNIENNRSVSNKVHQVEFIITTNYIKKYLKIKNPYKFNF